MEMIGAYEAKTHLPQLLDRIERFKTPAQAARYGPHTTISLQL